MVPFATLPDGTMIHQVTLRQSSGLEVNVITYGGIITAVRVPNGNRRPVNVVLGHDTLAPYLNNRNYVGALIGRYGNRIARGRFVLDGVAHQLDVNDGPNHLHGGFHGYNCRVWNVDGMSDSAVALSLVDPDGSCGYPGRLTARVTYRLCHDHALHIYYVADTDAPTIVNLTQHTYFNLSGGRSPTIDDHLLKIDADHYLPVDDELIPTGKEKEVKGTAFDFRSGRRIGDTTYDHTFILRNPTGELRMVARLTDPLSGRAMDVLTTEPGMQFYSGHLYDRPRAGLCLETQHYPNSPNEPFFPSTVLRPGARYTSTTVYRFGV